MLLKQCLNFEAAFGRNGENFVSINRCMPAHSEVSVSFNKGPYEYDAAKILARFSSAVYKKRVQSELGFLKMFYLIFQNMEIQPNRDFTVRRSLPLTKL